MTPRRRSFKTVTVLAALTFAGAAFAGCSTGSTADDEAEKPPSFANAEEYQLAFAECMRGEGIEMANSENGGQHVAAGSGDAFLEAAQACQDELGAPPASSNDGAPSGAEDHEVALKTAQCFRDNELEVSDPAPGESMSVPMDAPDELFEKCGKAGSTAEVAP